MPFLKSFYNYILAFVLFISVSGFSGITNYTTHLKNTQTELVVSDKIDNKTVIDYCDSALSTSHNAAVNQFTEFNFKSFLNFYHFNFRVTLKSQKQAVFEFIDINSLLEQNLIAYKYTSHTYNAFVK